MASKVQSPGPSSGTPSATRQARPRKPATENVTKQANVGRAGSAGGVVLEKEVKDKSTGASASKPTATKAPAPETTPMSTNKPRRKPRKLNKDPTTAPAENVAIPTKSPNVVTDAAATTELEALKSRVHGLEAKVEQLYSSGGDAKARSPRRRGKGRKTSSATQVPTLSSTTSNSKIQEIDGAEPEEADEELMRLEGELEVARQDLEAFRPRTRRTKSQETNAAAVGDDDVEEIPRSNGGAGGGNAADETRQITLSGSYRIPLPTSVSIDDVKSIQSGVAAAQNVARTFLEQRRVQQSQSQPASSSTQSTSKSQTSSRAKKPPTPRLSSSMEVAVATGEDGEKQSWGNWIGGYSMAISRAVKSIEHEAAVESQRGSGGGTGGAKRGAKKGGGGKRPVAKTTLSGEQVQGLMR